MVQAPFDVPRRTMLLSLGIRKADESGGWLAPMATDRNSPITRDHCPCPGLPPRKGLVERFHPGV